MGQSPRVGRLSVVFTVLLSAVLYLAQPATAAQLKEVRRVLIFNDVGTVASRGFAAMNQAIYSGLQDSPYQIELYNESLEAALFSDEESQRQVRDWYIRKYEKRKPDVIIAIGPFALKFMAETHEKSFRNIPIIFCGAWEQMLSGVKLDSHFTGAWAVSNPEKTLNLALKLQPSTRHVVVVGGTGTLDRELENIVRQDLRKYESAFEFTYLTELDLSTLLDRLHDLPTKTIVFFTALRQDAGGRRFISATQSLPMIAAAANAPVFVLDDIGVGTGAVGGEVLSWADQGRVAAGTAVRVLNGEKPKDIPLTRTPTVRMFDEQALQRFGLNVDALPPGYILLNRETSVWESYKWYIIGGASMILLQALLILELLWLRAKRKTTEKALKQSEEKFSKAFRHSPMSLTITTAKDNRYVDVNDTFLERTGWVREEVVGRSAPELGLWVEPERRVALAKALLSGEVIRNSEFKARLKGGEIRTCLRSAELIEINGEQCVLSVTTDITDLKRAEAILRESEERFRLVANTAPVMMWMAGTDKLYTYVNARWLEFTGRSLDGELGNGWAEGIHPDDVKQSMDSYEKAFDQRKPFQIEYRLRRHDGEYRWIIDAGAPRFNPDGTFAGYTGSAIDATELKKAEEALRMVSRRLIQAHEDERVWLARELHDDICQRLCMLIMDLRQLKDRVHAPTNDLKVAIAKAIEQASELANDTQGLSHRLHSSKLEYLGLVAATEGFCSELAHHHQVKVDLEAENIPRDLSQEISLCIFRVLQEALQNAIKHSGSPRFHVSLSCRSGQLMLTVQDGGIGFDPVEVVKGRGLGLTSMRERLKLVDGELVIESQPGMGTTLYVVVPLPAKTRAAASA